VTAAAEEHLLSDFDNEPGRREHDRFRDNGTQAATSG